MDKSCKLVWRVILLVCLASVSTCLTDDEVNEYIPEVEEVNDKVKLTVFYEALCPDSIDFFVHQLHKTYSSPLSHHINLDLVPYGLGKQSFTKGHWNFTCQHGPVECQYNKLHACALKLAKDVTKRNQFVVCLMANKQESAHLHKCASANHIELPPITKCAKSSLGDKLLAAQGKRTQAFHPKLKWVPSVAFNNVYTKDDQKEAMKNLSKVICNHLKHKPKQCKKHL